MTHEPVYIHEKSIKREMKSSGTSTNIPVHSRLSTEYLFLRSCTVPVYHQQIWRLSYCSTTMRLQLPYGL